MKSYSSERSNNYSKGFKKPLSFCVCGDCLCRSEFIHRSSVKDLGMWGEDGSEDADMLGVRLSMDEHHRGGQG